MSGSAADPAILVASIETAIIDRIKAASAAKVLGYSIRQVETLPTSFDSELGKFIAPTQLPATWVAWGGWKVVEESGDGSFTVEAPFSVVVAAGNLRNEKAQRHGAAGQVGSYQLVADVTGLLLGQTFGLPIAALKLGACTPLFSGAAQDDRKASLFMVGFSTRFEIAPETAALIETPGLGDFAAFNVGWDVPPHSGQADLTDTLHLPQDN